MPGSPRSVTQQGGNVAGAVAGTGNTGFDNRCWAGGFPPTLTIDVGLAERKWGTNDVGRPPAAPRPTPATEALAQERLLGASQQRRVRPNAFDVLVEVQTITLELVADFFGRLF